MLSVTFLLILLNEVVFHFLVFACDRSLCKLAECLGICAVFTLFHSFEVSMNLLGVPLLLPFSCRLLEASVLCVLLPHVSHIGRILGIFIPQRRHLLIQPLHGTFYVVLLLDSMNICLQSFSVDKGLIHSTLASFWSTIEFDLCKERK